MPEKDFYSREIVPTVPAPYSISLNNNQRRLLQIFKTPDSFIPNGDESFALKELGCNKSQFMRMARGLFGIVGTYDGHDLKYKLIGEKLIKTSFYKYGYFIPNANWKPLQDSLKNGGDFQSKIDANDLPTLEYIYTRSLELAQMRGAYGNPRFHPTEISKHTGTSKESARNSMSRLVGILAPTYVTKLIETPGTSLITDGTIAVNSPRWFLPHARIGEAERVLAGERKI
ncbi:MAG: hypothetical protein KBC00_00615 [Candidatus Levybacteria bacterium]|nr:hypothetical protein [Candidatus Levybacteria bacterium]MBP9815108.1 hypothetical protein [Candidatus Levybacteria bacterium]